MQRIPFKILCKIPFKMNTFFFPQEQLLENYIYAEPRTGLKISWFLATEKIYFIFPLNIFSYIFNFHQFNRIEKSANCA